MSLKFHRTKGGRRLRTAAAALVLSTTVGLAGCATSSAIGHQAESAPSPSATPSTQDPPQPAPSPESEPTEPAPEPTHIEIPRINARSTLVPLGLNPDETVVVPPLSQPMQAGWYSHGPRPGDAGAAVILGHVDGYGKPGIFLHLKNLQAGDDILIGRADGSTIRFVVVQRIQQVPKTQFPADAVYDEPTEPELRLVTCGGTYDRKTGNYSDNIIAYATIAR